MKRYIYAVLILFFASISNVFAEPLLKGYISNDNRYVLMFVTSINATSYDKMEAWHYIYKDITYFQARQGSNSFNCRYRGERELSLQEFNEQLAVLGTPGWGISMQKGSINGKQDVCALSSTRFQAFLLQ